MLPSRRAGRKDSDRPLRVFRRVFDIAWPDSLKSLISLLAFRPVCHCRRDAEAWGGGTAFRVPLHHSRMSTLSRPVVFDFGQAYAVALEIASEAYPNPGSTRARSHIHRQIVEALSQAGIQDSEELDLLARRLDVLPREEQGSVWKSLYATIVLLDLMDDISSAPRVIRHLAEELNTEVEAC